MCLNKNVYFIIIMSGDLAAHFTLNDLQIFFNEIIEKQRVCRNTVRNIGTTFYIVH